MHVLSPVSSPPANPGDSVPIQAVADVVVDGYVIVKAGADGLRDGPTVDRAASGGHSGTVTLDYVYVRAVDGEKVRLAASQAEASSHQSQVAIHDAQANANTDTAIATAQTAASRRRRNRRPRRARTARLNRRVRAPRAQGQGPDDRGATSRRCPRTSPARSTSHRPSATPASPLRRQPTTASRASATSKLPRAATHHTLTDTLHAGDHYSMRSRHRTATAATTIAIALTLAACSAGTQSRPPMLTASQLTVAVRSAEEAKPTCPGPSCIYTANNSGNSFTGYGEYSNGNIRPQRQIVGPSTGLESQVGARCTARSGTLYALNDPFGPGPSITISTHRRRAGNVQPARTIAGTNTRLNRPQRNRPSTLTATSTYST